VRCGPASTGGCVAAGVPTGAHGTSSPIKINEFRTGTSSNSTDSFIDLYNAGASAIDVSNWTLTEHPSQRGDVLDGDGSAGTTLAAGGHYLQFRKSWDIV
jgi:Lamin Tail Domain